MTPPTPEDTLQQAITGSGLRCTRQRKALYAALSQSRSHPTADELFRQVGHDLQGISLATVYNTLEAFCASGIAQKIPGVGHNGSSRYDATAHNHMHARCTKTGRVADVPEALGEKILKAIPRDTLDELEKSLGFKIDQVQVELLGEYQNPRPRA